jgi:hypothetical protein
MLSELNDRINDAGNTQVTEAQKIKYLNHGLRAMWPRIYRTVVDTSLELAVDDYEYTIPSTQDYGLPWRVEIETGDSTNIYVPLDDFEIINTITGKAIRLKWVPAPYGSRFRVTSAVPLTPFVNSASVYDGPPITEELPVWYALGIVMGRRLEDRTDYRRYSTTVAQNGVDINEVMNASQFAFAQFELLLERYTMAMPVGAP